MKKQFIIYSRLASELARQQQGVEGEGWTRLFSSNTEALARTEYAWLKRHNLVKEFRMVAIPASSDPQILDDVIPW